MVHYAAGILPVTWHDGQLLFLVGQDVRDRSWSDFGGKCERVDRNDPLNTACREFYEETYGCVLDHRALRTRLCMSNCLALRSRTQNNHPYWMFVVEVPYQPHLRNAFHKALAFLKHKNLCKMYVEKTDVRWVSWDMLCGSDLLKRPVFKTTLDTHMVILSRLAAREPWSKLCAEYMSLHLA
jgi:hypothetical protein